MTKPTDHTLFFVLHGWYNGVRGEKATTCGFDIQMADGWYFTKDDEEPDGHGPFATRDDAKEAAEK